MKRIVTDKTNEYRKIISTISVVILMGVITLGSVILAGCNSKKKAPTEIKIGVSVHDDSDIFVNSITKYMKEWCKEKEKETGIKLTIDVVSAMGSQLTQNDQVEKFIAKGYDVLCVNLVDRTDATLIIDNAMDADVPVVFFNRELVEEDLDRWDKLYYVGGVAEQSGRLQAQIIIDALSDKDEFNKYDVNHNDTIQYVILEGETRHQDAIMRTKVVTEELKNAGFSIEKLGDEYANWDRDQAKTKMLSLISKYPFQIEMVIANNDEMAIGAIEALEESNYPIDAYVVGIDGTQQGLEAIRSRRMDGSVYNDALGQSNAIMEIAYALSLDDEIPEDIALTFGKYVYLPYSIITYDNVQEYISL